jgi:hypothetical protein
MSIIVIRPRTPVVVANSPITALAQMNDVTFANLAENDVLKYLGGKWSNSPIGADASYLHIQPSASTTWVITHNLNKFPSCTVVDSAGDGVEGDVTYTNANQLTISFSAGFSGKAYLN